MYTFLFVVQSTVCSPLSVRHRAIEIARFIMININITEAAKYTNCFAMEMLLAALMSVVRP